MERIEKSSFVVNWLPILGTLTNIDTSEVGRMVGNYLLMQRYGRIPKMVQFLK